MKRIPSELIAFMQENVTGITSQELAERVNAVFGTTYTADQIKTIKSNHGLKCGRKPGLPSGLPSKTYPAEIRDYILANYDGVGPTEMTARLNDRFGTTYNVRQLSAYYKNHKLICGLTGRFEPGHVPPNKGRKGYFSPGSEKGWFRKGQQALNHKPVGSERIDARDGYVLIKTAEPNVYRPKHKVIWEAANGSVPPGHVITFIDGNKQNLDISNLRMITQGENATLNKKGLRGGDTNLFESGLLVARLSHLIYRRTKEAKQNAKAIRRTKDLRRED